MRPLVATLLLFSLALLAGASPAQGQLFGAEAPAVQAGVGAGPGAGVQAVYLQPRTAFTLEAALYTDLQSPFAGAGERRFQAAGAVGGSLRLLRVLRVVTGGGPGGNLDVGLRVGPGLRYQADETRAERNQRFRLLLDSFARYVRRVAGVRLFGEVGLARPRLRAGVWLAL
jgi:hypothetical protein